MLFAEAIRVALEDLGMSVTGVVSTGEDAVAAVRHSLPDIILMDLALPDQSGLAAGRTILERWPQARILALTALNDHATAQEAIRIGFRGYMTKDVSVAELVNSVRAVIGGHLIMPHRLGPASRGSDGDDHAALLAAQLTPREREVLALLVQGADGRTIARSLSISRNTVRTHVQSVLTKLQVHSRLEAATFAVRYGLVDLPMSADGGGRQVVSRSAITPPIRLDVVMS